ncbi:acyltransferase family protein [Maribellus mangrovi]|uniref:acyltransferase family protein n=1 Tax=Maribellus mangrovi TaxID=3133146 RepID=UPI0030EC94A3
MPSARIYYIDNIRVFLTALVVLFHLISTYGAPGKWYYVESAPESFVIIPMSIFIATNQTFFMGMFFMVSSFFLLPSLSRKGTKLFIQQRLLRLGIPLIAFYFLLGPLTCFIRDKYIYGMDARLLAYTYNPEIWYFGPMWFVEALLIFTFLFFLVRKLIINVKLKFPGTGKILLFALIIALLQFIMRIWLPARWTIPYTNFRITFFIQYIALFIIGMIAYQNHWFENIKIKISWRWFAFAQVLILIGFPLLYIAGGGIKMGEARFLGGFYWQNFAYCIWEQLVAVSMIYALLGIFKTYLNKQGSLAKKVSAAAYGVYVIHPPLLVFISFIFLNWHAPGLTKFLALAPLVLFICFFNAWLIKQFPGVKQIM